MDLHRPTLFHYSASHPVPQEIRAFLRICCQKGVPGEATTDMFPDTVCIEAHHRRRFQAELYETTGPSQVSSYHTYYGYELHFERNNRGILMSSHRLLRMKSPACEISNVTLV